jgi:hypothetical protein
MALAGSPVTPGVPDKTSSPYKLPTSHRWWQLRRAANEVLHVIYLRQDPYKPRKQKNKKDESHQTLRSSLVPFFILRPQTRKVRQRETTLPRLSVFFGLR